MGVEKHKSGKLQAMSKARSTARSTARSNGHTSAGDSPFESEAARFFAEVQDPLVGALTIRTGDRSLAEDLAQEAIARALADWQSVGVMANPRGWVFRVGFNLANSHWRRARIKARAERTHAPVEGDRSTAPGPDLLAVEHLVVREALDGLSKRQREVVILRHYVRMTVEETASVLGVSAGTVKTLNHRALAKMRNHLGEGS